MKTFKLSVMVMVVFLVPLICNALGFLTNGLVAYYPFNGQLADLVASNNMVHITFPTSSVAFPDYDTPLIDNPKFSTNRFGFSNSALFFDGTNNSYVRATNVDLGNIPFTMSIWAEANSQNETELLMPTENSSSSTLFGIGINMSSNSIQLVCNGWLAYGWEQNFIASVLISTNISPGWHHIVITDDNSAKLIIEDIGVVQTNELCLYVDGVNDGSVTVAPVVENGNSISFSPEFTPSTGQEFYKYANTNVRFYITPIYAVISSGADPVGGGIGGRIEDYYNIDYPTNTRPQPLLKDSRQFLKIALTIFKKQHVSLSFNSYV